MARVAFNVNTQTKLLDLYGQFNGGLKTVDTDDALRDFFLRQAENVSISEFGFLEKRYGLTKKRQFTFVDGIDPVSFNSNDIVQGYIKFNYGANTDELIAIDGYFYKREHGETAFKRVNTFVTDNAFKYPQRIVDGSVTSDLPTNFTNGIFQNTREVGFARIEDKLYIFTGSYPLIYSRNNLATGEPHNPVGGKLYVMPYYVPNFAEIASLGQGINLLISDFERVYGYDDLDLSTQFTDFNGNWAEAGRPNIRIKEQTYAPLVPFVKNTDTQLRFELALDMDLPKEAVYKFATLNANNYVYQLGEYVPRAYYTVFDDQNGTLTPPGETCTGPDDKVAYNGDYYDCVWNAASNGADIQIVPQVSIKPFGSNESSYVALTESQLVRRDFYTNSEEDSPSHATHQHEDLPFHLWDRRGENGIVPIGYLDGSYIWRSTLLNIGVDGNLDAADQPNMSVEINGIPAGVWDFKVDVVYTKAIEDNNGDIIEADTFVATSAVFERVTVTETQLSGTEVIPSKALWSANQVMVHYDKLLAWGSTLSPETLFVSDPTEKNWFPQTSRIKFDTDEDEPIKAITPFMQILVVQSEGKTWGLKGTQSSVIAANTTGEALYEVFDISPVYGTIAPKSVRPVRNRLYFLSREGIVELNSLYAVDYRYNVNELDRNIKDIVPRDVNAVGIQHDYQYWLNFPSTGETLRYYIDKKAWVKDTYGKDDNDSYSANRFLFDGVHKYISKDGVLTFITNLTGLDTDPAVLGVYELTIDKSMPSDLNKPFKSAFETANLNQNYPFHQKKYLENRLDFTLQNEYNLGKEPLTKQNEVRQSAYHQFRALLLPHHEYQLGYEENIISNVTAVEYSLDGSTWIAVESYDLGTQDTILTFLLPEFVVPNDRLVYIKVTATYPAENLSYVSVLRDKTYASEISFNTFSISEQGTLNIDNLTSYDAEEAVVSVNLGTVFGENETWVFDESAFNDRITAVKTVKLSGRGYNYKLLFTDRSKAKWTLETLGITFKFKRARGEG